MGVPLHDANELNKYVGSAPPAEMALLMNGVPDVPIVGFDVTVAETLENTLYKPVHDGTFSGFSPVFIDIGTMANLHADPDWTTAQAYLGRLGLRPVVVFNSTVRRTRGRQVFVGDFRAFAT